MVVELDIFSGRPNPRWTLASAGERELRRLHGRLKRSSAAPPDPPGLGYRGFVYTDGRERWHAYRGYIRGARAVLVDPTFSIERWLLDTLPDEHAAIKSKVRPELVR